MDWAIVGSMISQFNSMNWVDLGEQVEGTEDILGSVLSFHWSQLIGGLP